MAVTETTIGGWSKSNIGYLRKVYLLKRTDVLQVCDPLRFKTVGGYVIAANGSRVIAASGIVVKDSSQYVLVRFPNQSATAKVNEVAMGSNYVYDYVLAGDMPGAQEDILAFRDANREQQFVLIFEDNNGRVWIIGNEERGLVMRVNGVIGAENSFFIEFSGRLNVPIFRVEGINLPSFWANCEFSTEFSTDFLA